MDRTTQLAVILHADVVGSTALVQQNEQLAHARIREAFERFASVIGKYHGRVRELRGDALLAEFERASDAVTASLAFQEAEAPVLAAMDDGITPVVRVGIAMGEVVIADGTITGAGVVLAQRLEQLAEPGTVVIQGAAYETVPGRFPFEYEYLGEHQVKGFDEPVRAYSPQLKADAAMPSESEPNRTPSRRRPIASAAVVIACVAGIAGWLWSQQPEFEPANPASMSYSLPDGVSVAVLPFENLTADESNRYLADGFVDSVITELSRAKDALVIARGSSFSFRGQNKAHKEIAEALGVRYLVDGSFQRLGDQLRINVNAVDAIEGRQIWSQRYDRPAEDFYKVQDELVLDLVQEIGSRGGGIFLAERERILGIETNDLRVMELWEKATHSFFEMTEEANARTKDHGEALIARAPTHTRGHIAVGWHHLSQVWNGWSKDAKKDVEAACRLSDKAIQLNRLDYQGHWLRAYCKAAQGDRDAAALSMTRTRELNPNDVLIQRDYVEFVLTYEQRFEEAAETLKKFLRLNPAQRRYMNTKLGDVYLLTGRFADALKHYRREVVQGPLNDLRVVAALWLMGQENDAAQAADAVLKQSPKINVDTLFTLMPITDHKVKAQLRQALALAGIAQPPASWQRGTSPWPTLTRHRRVSR